MTNNELCSFIDTSIQTLYNWKKNKPNLYKIVMDFKNNLNSINLNENIDDELKTIFQELTENEKEYFKSAMKAAIFKRKI